jgi:hypothetical protein
MEGMRFMAARNPNEPVHMIVAAAAHRSGSTLLQRICNIRKETLIWGEHGGLLNEFVTIFTWLRYFSENSVSERAAFFENGHDPNQWIANMTPELKYVERAVVRSIRTLMAELYAPYRKDYDRIGFKEVRYGREALELFRKCFPEAVILLLVRNPVDTWASSSDWYEHIGDFAGKWNNNAAYFLEMAERDPHAHLITYENLANRERKTLDTVSRIAQVPRKEMEATLACKLGSRRRAIPDKDVLYILNECGDVMKRYGYC